MATRDAKRKLQRSANTIRRALPDENKIAMAMCESGFGLSWKLIPEELKEVLRHSARKSLYISSSLMAREPEVLQQANSARILKEQGTGVAGQ